MILFANGVFDMYQCNNLGQNIFRLFRVLAQFLFTTREVELDYNHQKVNAELSHKLPNNARSYETRKFQENL